MKTTQLSSTRRLITAGSILTTALMLLTLTHNASAQSGVKQYSVSVPSQGNVNSTYEIMRIGRDSANWSNDMPYEVTVYTNYFLNGSMTKWLLTYGYTDSGTATPLQAYGAQMLRVYLGSEVVVSGTIKYRPVLVDLPNYMAMRIEVKYDTTDVGSISGSGQVQFTGSVAGGSGTTYNGDIWLSPNGGNVGIGTMSPAQKLHVAGNVLLNQTNALIFDQNYTVHGNLSVTSDGGDSMPRPRYEGYYGQRFITWAGEVLRIQQNGNVGIGTTTPGSRLEVSSGTSDPFFFNGTYNKFKTALGWTYLESYHGAEIVIDNSGNYSDRTFTVSKGASRIGGGSPTPLLTVQENGNVNISGTVNAKYQDVAEWVPASEQLPVGTVVVLDATKSNQVTSSSVSYDTRVAGVVSAQPGIALGEQSDNKVLVATTGRVRVKVDATKAPIHIGDLLVTSDVPGMAMKSEPIMIGGRQIHAPGTLIGKALEPLEKGKGTILVLLSLQ